VSEQASLSHWDHQLRLDGLKVVHERRDTPKTPSASRPPPRPMSACARTVAGPPTRCIAASTPSRSGACPTARKPSS
jgi:hypothetical protein